MINVKPVAGQDNKALFSYVLNTYGVKVHTKARTFYECVAMGVKKVDDKSVKAGLLSRLAGEKKDVFEVRAILLNTLLHKFIAIIHRFGCNVQKIIVGCCVTNVRQDGHERIDG